MVINKYLAELIGTFILVGVGSLSIISGGAAGVPVLLTAPFGFGLGLMAAIFAVGHVSGGHFNPAVTLAMFLDKRTDFSDLVGYWIGQVAGAILASLLIWAAAGSRAAVAATYTNPAAGEGESFAIELALTAVFVLVIMASTKAAPRVAGIVIPLTLVAIHFAAVPLTGASVNPARSLAPALIGDTGAGLWLYLVAPMVGAVIAWALFRLFGVEEGDG